MTARKQPHELKGRGGKRVNSGRNGKLDDMAARLDWSQHLYRAVTAASGNMGIIKKDAFFSIREIQERWGKQAVLEFKDWFEAKRHCDTETADRLLQDLMTGRLDEDKYQKLLFTKAFHWIWSLNQESRIFAWEMTRGLKSIEQMRNALSAPVPK